MALYVSSLCESLPVALVLTLMSSMGTSMSLLGSDMSVCIRLADVRKHEQQKFAAGSSYAEHCLPALRGIRLASA